MTTALKPYCDATRGMQRLNGGLFVMGSDRHYPEEAPAHRVRVDPFWIDETPVTNARFTEFVRATGYVTTAEMAPDPSDYPGALPHMLRAGSLVFTQPAGPVALHDLNQWWRFVFGADWRHPDGPASSLADRLEHPVIHISHADATAYAQWAGKSLPTEAEWEFAARGGIDGAEFAWGDRVAPDSHPMANTWQGQFPYENLCLDGWARTSPVGAFPPNGFGLFDMIGNVWEWTDDFYAPKYGSGSDAPCCVPRNPRGPAAAGSHDPSQPDIAIARKVLKGGSHLCAPSYCERYRPAARYPQPVDTSTTHVGFRCVIRPTAEELHQSFT